MTNGEQQHDLSPHAAKSFVATAGIRKRDTVFEVGAGLGELTAALLPASAKVVAVERDPARVATLRTRFESQIADGRLHLISGDARRIVPDVPADWRVVANPPFNLTAELIRRLLLEDWPSGPPRALDLVLQFQAAQKLSFGPPEYTRSSALIHLFGTPRIVKRLRREDVTPPSRVDLCGWSLIRHDDAPPENEMRAVDQVLERAFAGPHTVSDALRGLATSTQIKRQAREHGWNPAAHPRELPPQAWWHMATILMKAGQVRGR
jgi:16S rRNA (adenine1518-N6/adenine1519-N6)-dimethyltransferase